MSDGIARDRLSELAAQRILVLDGAMGTMIQAHELGEADFRGARFRDHEADLRGDNDLLSLTQPEIVIGIHGAYLEAGADIVTTNTFNGNAFSQGEYGLDGIAYELNREAAGLAKEACAEWTARTP